MKNMDFTKDKNLLRLCKRLRRYYRNETAYSITLKKWEPRVVLYLRERRFIPGKVNDIINIAITLQRHFGNDQQSSIYLAESIYKYHWITINQYMSEWFNFGKGNQRIKILFPKKALQEQIARGFIPMNKFDLDYSLPYIKSLVLDMYGNTLVYPKQWLFKPNQNMCGVYERRIGVSGYTAIVLPKGLYKI